MITSIRADFLSRLFFSQSKVIKIIESFQNEIKKKTGWKSKEPLAYDMLKASPD